MSTKTRRVKRTIQPMGRQFETPIGAIGRWNRLIMGCSEPRTDSTNSCCSARSAGSLLEKSCSDDKEVAAHCGGRRATYALSKATSATVGGRYPEFFNRLLTAR